MRARYAIHCSMSYTSVSALAGVPCAASVDARQTQFRFLRRSCSDSGGLFFGLYARFRRFGPFRLFWRIHFGDARRRSRFNLRINNP